MRGDSGGVKESKCAQEQASRHPYQHLRRLGFLLDVHLHAANLELKDTAIFSSAVCLFPPQMGQLRVCTRTAFVCLQDSRGKRGFSWERGSR